MKKIHIFILLSAIIFVSGCNLKKDKEPALALLIPPFSLYAQQSQTTDNATPSSSAEFTPIPDKPVTTTVAFTTPTPPQDTKFKTIKEAMDKALSLQCPYVDATGKKVVAYVKDRKIRIDSNDPADTTNKNTHMLFKYSQAWIWNTDTREGVVVNLESLEAGKQFRMGKTTIKSAADVLNVLESKVRACQYAVVADTIFDIPANVTFVGDTVTSAL